MTAAPAGYGVLAEGKLCAWIEPDEALGADLLLGGTAGRTLDVLDLEGMPATLMLQQGSCRLLPVWDEDGSLRGLDVTAQVRAAVLETAADSAVGTEAYDDHLTAQLESAVSDRIGRILRLERQLSLDFLGLEGLRLSSPDRWQPLTEPLGALLPGLEISITVRGEIAHSFDAKDAQSVLNRVLILRMLHLFNVKGAKMTTDQFSRRQLFALGAAAALSPALRLYPALSVRLAGKGAWLSALCCLPPLLLYAFFCSRLAAARREGEGLGELMLRALGEKPGRAVLLLLGLWLLLYAGFVLRAAADRFVVALFPHSAPTFVSSRWGSPPSRRRWVRRGRSRAWRGCSFRCCWA